MVAKFHEVAADVTINRKEPQVKPVTLADLNPGDRFQTWVNPNDPWVELRTLTPKTGVLIDKGEGGATVRYGEATTVHVVIRNQIDGSVEREFDGQRVPAAVRVALGSPVVKL
jgi:hypothetical protein